MKLQWPRSTLFPSVIIPPLHHFLGADEREDRCGRVQFEEIVKKAQPSTSYQDPFKPISHVFEPYFSVYVDAQDRFVLPLAPPPPVLLDCSLAADKIRNYL